MNISIFFILVKCVLKNVPSNPKPSLPELMRTHGGFYLHYVPRVGGVGGWVHGRTFTTLIPGIQNMLFLFPDRRANDQ